MQTPILFIILARGGSRRIKNKNMKIFKKKPLISWTLEQALRIKKNQDKVLLSTDSQQIIEYSKKFKKLEIIKRPKKLATASSSSLEAIRHAVNKLNYNGNIILLQPTSPLRSDNDVTQAIKLIQKGKIPLMSVCECTHDSSLLTFRVPLSQKFLPINNNKSKVYFPNGAIYGTDSDWVKKNNSFYLKNTHMYLMPEKRSVDIDYEYQFIMGEALFRSKSHE